MLGTFAALSIAMLGGCVSVVIETPTPGPAVTAHSGGWMDPRCSEIGGGPEFSLLWAVAPEATAYHSYGAESVWSMQGSALIQAGALVCVWGSDGEAPSAVMIAMGEASEGFRRSEPSFADPASGYSPVDRWDSAYATCRTDGALRCHWNVLAGSTWVSVLLRDVPKSDVEAADLATTSSAEFVATLVERVRQVGPLPAASDPGSWSCASTLTPELVAAAWEVDASRLGASAGAPLEAALGRSTPDFGQTMWAYAQELVGYRECHLALDGEMVASIVSAPGGAWLLDSPNIAPGELAGDVAGLGPGLDRCETESGFTLCTVAVARGEDLVVVQVPAGSTEDAARAVAAALAAIILA